jgi:hypothetical protein
MKENTTGKMRVESKTSDVEEFSVATLGIMIPEITAVDTSAQVLKEDFVTKGQIIGDVEIDQKTNSVAMPVDSIVEETEIVYKPMDTVVIQSYGATTGKIMLSGAISVCRVETVQQEKDSVQQETNIDNEIKFKAYPNPVRAGSLLNLSFESSGDFPEILQIVSSSGQLISQLKQNSKTTIINIQIPSNITDGIYFLRLITKNKETKTTKIIVTK